MRRQRRRSRHKMRKKMQECKKKRSKMTFSENISTKQLQNFELSTPTTDKLHNRQHSSPIKSIRFVLNSLNNFSFSIDSLSLHPIYSLMTEYRFVLTIRQEKTTSVAGNILAIQSIRT